jgi:hypothetical protein
MGFWGIMEQGIFLQWEQGNEAENHGEQGNM